MQRLVCLENNVRLDKFLESQTGLTRNKLQRSIESELVLVNKKVITKNGYKLKQNDVVEYDILEEKTLNANPERIDIDVRFENENLLVINKPSGMVVHPACGNYSGTLVNALVYYTQNLSKLNGDFRPGIVHRLDKDTSGLLLVAKNDFAHESLANQIKEKTCKRYYLAVLEGNLKQDSGIIETNLDRSKKDRKKYEVCPDNQGKRAITLFNVVKHLKGYTLVEFELKTGRTHQIRVHAKYLGHPVVGDMTYGFKNNEKLNGQLLHAYKIMFFEPSTNEQITIECELPEKMQKFIKEKEE